MLVVAELEQLPVPRAKAGEPEAWSTLFRRYQLPLYVYVFELVRDEQASLDIVQETFIAAVRHIGSLREEAKFGGWLFGIAHQKCIQLWRKKSRAEVLRDEIAESPADLEDSPDEMLIRQEQEAEFMKLLNQLPVPQRSVLLLHFVEDFSLQQIAEITATPVGTVKSRLHYAKRALRKILEEESK
jgi:RNA polymerase sigma-70 factor (ECF subfamily)